MSGSTFSMDFDAHAGRSPRRPWWFSVLACTALMLAVPQYGDTAMQLDLSLVMILSLLALSIGFLWGYVGILSFGQTIFFGLGGYAYALCSLNTDLPLAAFALAAVVPMLFALLLGYFMMYGRISDIYLSVITLVVTLIFEKGVRATSGPEYVIGSVRLNGQNGIPGLPGLPLRIGPLDLQSIEGIFYLALGLLALAYIGIRLFLASARARDGGPARKRAPHGTAGVRQPAVQADGLRHRRRPRGLSGGLYAVGQLRRPGNVQPESGRDGGHLGDRGRALAAAGRHHRHLADPVSHHLAGHGGRGAGHAEPGFHIDSLRAAVSAGAGAGMQEPAGPAAAAAARRSD